MKSSTAYNHQVRLLQLLNSIWSLTRTFKRDHKAHLIAMSKFHNDDAFGRVPNHVKDYLSGYGACLWNHFTLNETIWVLPFNNVNYLKWDDLPVQGKDAYRANKLIGKHVHKSDMLSNW